MSRTLDSVLAEVYAEVARAICKHAPMHSPHEGWAVLQEEVDELWDEVKAQQHNGHDMRKEAIQCAAMAVRFVLDVCDKSQPAPPATTDSGERREGEE